MTVTLLNDRVEMEIMDTEAALTLLKSAKQLKVEAEDLIAVATKRLVEIAEQQETSVICAEVDGQQVSAAIVSPERVTYDVKALKRELGAAKWKLISIERVDSTLLSKAIQNGKIDPVVAMNHSQIIKSKPYLRLSVGDTTQQPDS